MRTAAILPVKRFSAAKQRLGASVGEKARAELARAMVADVLAALARSASLQLLIVVTDEPSVAVAARGQGALVLADTADAGQSAAVEIGVRHALAEGIERVLCVPGDCPALDTGELECLLRPGAAKAEGVAELYGELLDGIVADEDVVALPTLNTNTRMIDAAAAARVAREALGFAGALGG